MNFRQLNGLVVSAALLMTLSSCKKKEESRDIDVKAIQTNAKSTPSQKAEELAKAAQRCIVSALDNSNAVNIAIVEDGVEKFDNSP